LDSISSIANKATSFSKILSMLVQRHCRKLVKKETRVYTKRVTAIMQYTKLIEEY